MKSEPAREATSVRATPPPRRLALLLALAPLGASAQESPADATAAQFSDPAPPEVTTLEPMAGSQPVATPELTFHAAPKPLAKGARIEEWPGFLGPRRDAHSRETPILKEWSAAGPKLVWEVATGQGFSSPVVVGERLVFTHRVGELEFVDCLEASTGKRYWRVSSPCDYRGEYIGDGGPRATPLIVGEFVYVHGVQGLLRCLELSTGRVLWQRNTSKDYGISDHFFGVVSSPIAHRGTLIQNLGAPPPTGPSVAAFDLMTGRAVWGAGRLWGPSCASPVLAATRPGGTGERVFVITGGKTRPPSGGLMVIDPEVGEVEFEYPFRSRTFESVNGASPVIGNQRVLLTATYGLGTACIGFEAQSADARFGELWKDRHIGFQFSTPVYEDGVYYGIDGVSGRSGALIAIDPTSGKELSRTSLDWKYEIEDVGERKVLTGSVGEGSLLVCKDTLLCLGDSGDLLSIAATPAGARILSRASLFRASDTWTPLVLCRGLLYVCQNTRARFGKSQPRLLCYDLRGVD